jgi:quinoprotein glucose dehydrogenase
MKAWWRIVRWPLLLGVTVALLLLGAEWKFHLVSKVRKEGVGKLAGVAYDRLRKEGVAATWNAIFNKVGDTLATQDVRHSIFEPLPPGLLESAAERAQLPEYKVIPGIDPAKLAPSTEVYGQGGATFDHWYRSHGDDGSTKFSAHAQIHTGNVGRLEVAWTNASGADLGDPSKLGTTVQTNPVMAGRRLFVGGERNVRAIDAATGKDVWVRPLPGPVARRGLVWEPNADFTQSRLFVPTAKGVYALNAADGRVIEGWGDEGHVGGELSLIAPVIVGDRLVIAIARPALEAYDLKTGKLLWTTPLLDRAALRGSTLYGGVPWAGMSADPKRRRVFVATGNARPQMVGSSRPGDNRNTCSVVAIDTDTGAIAWAFQEVAHDLWDLDVPSPPVLTTITRGGQRVDVVATVTKIGNTLLLDRDSGQPIFDYRLRRAPTSTIPGERTAAYQPALELPQPFAKQAFEPGDITDLSDSARAAVLRKTRGAKMGFFEPPQLGGAVVAYGLQGGAEWPGAAVDPRSGVLYVPSNELPWMVRAHYLDQKATAEAAAKVPGDALYQSRCAGCHRPTGEGRYETEREGDLHYPVLNGITALRSQAQLTSPAEFALQHQAVKLPAETTAAELATLYTYFSALDRRADQARSFIMTGFWQVLLDDQGRPGSKPPWGQLTAIDLNTGKHLWQVPFGQYDKLQREGKPVQGQRNHGGLIATAGGLLFATGTLDNKLRAIDAATGRELWSYTLPAAGSTPPTTYMLDGVQYLVVVAGGGQHVEFSGRSDKIIAFRLPPAAR